MPFHSSVAASKGAVEGLAKSMAAEFAASKIRVNVIAPSLTDTPLASSLLSSAEKKEAAAKRHPLNRIGDAAEIAQLTAFLLSDNAQFITGQVIGTDGGLGNLNSLNSRSS
jgi:NAD(P)-dependent dehydrogenase (short-subunit alcohol dehydrogenase family)